MCESKRKRLAAEGWTVGNIQDFLKLSDQEQACVDLKLRLADALTRQRPRRKLMQAVPAEAVHSSQSGVARMEARDSTVSMDLLVRALYAAGTTDKALAKIVASRGFT